MADKRDQDQPKGPDQRVSIPLDPKEALSGLLRADPTADVAQSGDAKPRANDRPNARES